MMKVLGPGTANVVKVMACLGELDIPFERVSVNISSGEQFTPEFLAISPNNRCPVLIDDEPADGGEPISIFESGAILIYLAEKAGALLPESPRERSAVMAWLMWQMSSMGPMLGQAVHFNNISPERIPYAMERYNREADRLYGVLDTRLKGREFIAGDFSIADLACWPWSVFHTHHAIDLADFPEVERWNKAIAARPGVQKGLVGWELPQSKNVFPDLEFRVMFQQARITA